MEEDRTTKLIWAGAMTQVAKECAAALPTLPPAARRLQGVRINALSTVAQELMQAAARLPVRPLDRRNHDPPPDRPRNPDSHRR